MSSLNSCFVAKQLAEMFEQFSNLETPEEDYIEIVDFKKNQSCFLPPSTAANFLKLLCTGVRDGVMDEGGDAIFYYGESLDESSRPLRIRFRANVKRADDFDFSNTVKLIVSCMVIALGELFHLPENGKEYKTCGVMYSTELKSSEFDITVFFPYCRMKSTDLKSVFIPRVLEHVKSIPDFKIRFSGRIDDIIHQESFDKQVPMFGCVTNIDQGEPNDLIETWYIGKMLKTTEDIFSDDITQMEEEEEEGAGVRVEDHPIFKKNLTNRLDNPGERSTLRPLIYTNYFGKERERLRLKAADSHGHRSRDSPSERTRVRREKEREELAKNKTLIERVRMEFETNESFANVQTYERKRLVNLMKHGMKNDDIAMEINKLIQTVAEIEYEKKDTEGTSRLWFKIELEETKPAIQVGAEGLYISFSNLYPILIRLGEWRCRVTSQLEDIACIIYTMANHHEKEDAKDYFTGFVERKCPDVFQTLGEKALNSIFDRQKERAVKKRLTVWTLLHMFEEDDELYYNIWWKYICDYYILHSMDDDMASFSVARAASILLIGKYIHTTGDAKQTWWKYTGTYWKNIHDTQAIELSLTTTFIENIICAQNRYKTKEAIFCKNPKKATYLILRQRISDSSFRNNIVRDMSNIFLRDNRLLTFASGTDPEYSNFFATINNVYYYSDGKMNKRKGHWEDFLTRAFDVIDEDLHVKTDPKCRFILDWIHKMLGDRDTEHEFLKELASFLRGFNRDKRFSVWFGHGNGGKSKFMDLVCSTLGLVDGYAVKFPLETLLEGAKKSAGAASPEIDQGRGAFLAVLDEPKKGQKFDAGKIKAITGNDAMYTRTLFSKGGSFRPMFKTVLLGNVLPKADYDMAMKIRFWVWHFRGRFAERDECPVTEEEQYRQGIFPLDKDLDNKLPQYKSAMLSIMLHYYEVYCREGVRRTEGIRRATDMFWNSANDVLCFLSEQTTKANDLETYVPVDDLYDAFRRWFMNRNNGERVMTKIIFQDELEAIYTSQKIKDQGGVAGIRLRDGV
jgi:hypothetical protein